MAERIPLSECLTLALSARTLFNMTDANNVFETQGADAFNAYMLERQDVPMRPGPALPLVQKFQRINTVVPGLVHIVLLSRASPVAGRRILRSLQHYGLVSSSNEVALALSSGANRFQYAQALGVDLFLSGYAPDVLQSINGGLAAATIPLFDTDYAEISEEELRNNPLCIPRIAFDGDAVLFDGTADNVYRTQGMTAFRQHAVDNAHEPMNPGPFHAFLLKLHSIRNRLAIADPSRKHLEISLVTARGAEAMQQVWTTLNAWEIEPDTLIAAAGRPKGPILQAGAADVLFDDTAYNLTSAQAHGVIGAHVPFGAGGIVR